MVKIVNWFQKRKKKKEKKILLMLKNKQFFFQSKLLMIFGDISYIHSLNMCFFLFSRPFFSCHDIKHLSRPVALQDTTVFRKLWWKNKYHIILSTTVRWNSHQHPLYLIVGKKCASECYISSFHWKQNKKMLLSVKLWTGSARSHVFIKNFYLLTTSF